MFFGDVFSNHKFWDKESGVVKEPTPKKETRAPVSNALGVSILQKNVQNPVWCMIVLMINYVFQVPNKN